MIFFQYNLEQNILILWTWTKTISQSIQKKKICSLSSSISSASLRPPSPPHAPISPASAHHSSWGLLSLPLPLPLTPDTHQRHCHLPFGGWLCLASPSAGLLCSFLSHLCCLPPPHLLGLETSPRAQLQRQSPPQVKCDSLPRHSITLKVRRPSVGLTDGSERTRWEEPHLKSSI